MRYAVRDLGAELIGRTSTSRVLREDEFWALRGIDFELARGECIGLIGHNGAGKTTLLKLLNGLIKPDEGRIEVNGRMIALIALGAGFNPVLTGRENIYVNSAIFGLSSYETDAVLVDIIGFAEIGDFIDAAVQTYSSGMVVRLAFSIAIHCRPDILILDEVLAVGDIGFQIKCYNALAKLRKKGVGFVLVSHNMHQISRFASRTLYLRRGVIVHFGENNDAIAAYLKDSGDSYTGIGFRHEVDRPTGSGNITLLNARFLDKTGDQITSIKPGDAVVLAVDFMCSSTPPDDAALDVLVMDSKSTVFQATKVFAKRESPLPERGCFKVSFDCIPCNAQALYFSCALIGSLGVEIYDCVFDLKLEVHKDHSSHGDLVLPVSWSMD